jgi:hypothetical protein
MQQVSSAKIKKDTKVSLHKHESFVIRANWLHKGIKHIDKQPSLFANISKDSTTACDLLGIGVNMVKALRYWLVATRLIEPTSLHKSEYRLTQWSRLIHKYDPYLDEIGTKLLVHWLLVSNKQEAIAWYWLYNQHKGVLTKNIFESEFGQYLDHNNLVDKMPSPKVVDTEYSTLIRTYCDPKTQKQDPEENRICPLTDLNLLVPIANSYNRAYHKSGSKYVPEYIAYAVIMAQLCSSIDNATQSTNIDEIAISQIAQGDNSIGNTFCLDRIAIFEVLDRLSNLGLVKVVRTAGLDTVQIIKKITPQDCVELYYTTLTK